MRIILSFLLFGTSAFATETIFAPALSEFSSNNYHGYAAAADARVRTESETYTLGFQHLSRTFSGQNELSETSILAGASFVIDPSHYLEINAAATPDAQFSAKDAINTTPHWIYKQSDFGLRIGYSKYTSLESGQLVPSLYQDFDGQWSGYFATYFVRTNDYLLAGQVKFNFTFYQKNKLTAGTAIGRTLEDEGIEADFKSTELGYSYQFKRWSLGLSQNQYWSNIRREDSYILRLEIR